MDSSEADRDRRSFCRAEKQRGNERSKTKERFSGNTVWPCSFTIDFHSEKIDEKRISSYFPGTFV